MTVIRIREFCGYSQQDFLQFLNIHNKSFFEIIIPKQYSEEEDGELFLQDFLNAIYVGQLLSRISHDIMCNLPDPYEKGEFSFIIINDQLQELSALLLYFCRSFDWQNHQNDCIAFELMAASDEKFMQEGEEYACPPYVAFINQYLEENE